MKWKIESIHHKASGSFEGISDRVLTQVCYTVSISGSGHEALKQAWVELEPPVTSSFTAFNDLSENQVVGWVTSSLGTDMLTKIQTQLNKKLNIKINNTQSQNTLRGDMPWDG